MHEFPSVSYLAGEGEKKEKKKHDDSSRLLVAEIVRVA